jgi:hypothetical protein
MWIDLDLYRFIGKIVMLHITELQIQYSVYLFEAGSICIRKVAKNLIGNSIMKYLVHLMTHIVVFNKILLTIEVLLVVIKVNLICISSI